MKNIKKILLITLTPPGEKNVGEVILRDLCALLPKDKLIIFTVAPHKPNNELCYNNEFALAPNETSWRPLPGLAGSLCGHLYYRIIFIHKISHIVNEVVKFARAQEVQKILITLNSVTLISLGAEVARQLEVPLLGLVWDPPNWMAMKHGLDRLSRKLLEKRFGDALRISDRVAVVSEGMAKIYNQRYKCNCVVLRHALSNMKTQTYKTTCNSNKKIPLRIGFAGTLYDTSQFNMLLEGMNLCGWKIDERIVNLRMVGNWFRFNGMNFPCNIELKGWQSTDDTLQLLSECDVNYLPIPFSEGWKEFATLSFPTKLSAYIASGRPVFIHGPDYASSIKFCEQTRIGITCSELDPEKILTAIHNFLNDEKRYSQALENVYRAREEYFSPSVMKRQFARFLGVDEVSLNG